MSTHYYFKSGLISKVTTNRLDEQHDMIAVWIRGQFAGTLVVGNKSDADAVFSQLLSFPEDMHVGYRFCAGRYCFKCDATLFKGGVERLKEHLASHVPITDEKSIWYDSCPTCGRNHVFHPEFVKGCMCFEFSMSASDIASHFAEGMVIADNFGNIFTKDDFYELTEKICKMQIPYLE